MKGTALIYRPAAVEPEIRELSAPPSLELLQGAVGGYIEAVPHWDRVNFEDAMHRCVAFCNEDGKGMGLPLNIPATQLWHAALPPPGLIGRDGQMADVLVGAVIVVFGDAEFMEEL